MPIIFLINDRDAGMSKNQWCRLLEKPLWDAGHFQLFQSFVKRSRSRPSYDVYRTPDYSTSYAGLHDLTRT